MVPLTRHGFREMLIGSLVLVAVAVVLGYSIWWPISFIVLPVLIWLFAFFRDPERTLPSEQHAMVSPADGTVSDVMELEHNDCSAGRACASGSSCRSSTCT
jgi:phosphatidylserine decarboxylase